VKTAVRHRAGGTSGRQAGREHVRCIVVVVRPGQVRRE
jgi:hypothetical protein